MPAITSFVAAAPVLEAGASTQLTAVFTNGNGSISPGIGAVTSGTPVTIKPDMTTLYTLTVSDTSGHSDALPLYVGVKKPPFEMVSLGSTGVPADSQSYLAKHTISADGRFVAFASMDNTLVPNDSNGSTDIFVRDRQTGTTLCASRATDGTAANAYSDYPMISAGGRYVVFESHATNLVAGVNPTRGYADIYRYDLQTQQTTLVSVDSAGSLGSGSSYHPSISADGRFVAFASDAQLTSVFNTQTAVYLRDTLNQVTTLISHRGDGSFCQGSNPAISADGTRVVFESFDDPMGLGATVWEFYANDLATGAISLVSASATGTPREQGSESTSRGVQASVSKDGRWVTFCTTATNLVPGTFTTNQNVFAKDTQTGAIQLLSQNAAGVFGDADSVRSQGGRASISANGDLVTYNTSATNLVGGQYGTMASNLVTGEVEVICPGSGFIGDTDPAMSPDPYGRFVVLAAGVHLDPRYDYRGLFLKDRHVAPVAVAGPMQVVSVGAVATLDGSGSQVSTNPKPFPAAPTLSYSWNQLAGPSISFTNPGTSRPSFTASAAGTYVFQLVVNDTIENSLPVLAIVRAQ
ncbi:MAG TPA: hypothetical protein VJ486_02910 [Geothrix sp.]|nr:hypothetical protein [Geothrix sp.]